MFRLLPLAFGAALCTTAHAQTTLTYSSWVSPQHHLSIWQANWTAEVEKATGGRVKFQSLPKHPSAPPGTFDAVRDGLIVSGREYAWPMGLSGAPCSTV